MTQQTMSITRALVELKRLTDRINHAISSGRFVSSTIGKGNYQKLFQSAAVSIEAEKQTIQGSFDKVESLMAYRSKLKSQIVLSNARTMVKVLGMDMTVAEAIEFKSTIDLRKTYVAQLRKQLMDRTQKVDLQNQALEAAIENSLNSIYGADNKGKIDASLVANVANPQREQKEAQLLDPNGIQKKIDALTEEISQLESEVDFVLSESNARTTITVDA